jgi:hypothetical protein
MKAHAHGIPDQIFNTDTDPGHIHAVSYVNSSSGANVRATESSSNA